MTESIADTLPRAGLLRRLAALLYDGFLVTAIWMILGFLLQFIAGPDTNQLVDGQVQTDPLLSNILFILMVTSAAAFYIWFWTRSGQTLGMIAWKMKAVSLDGNLMTVSQGLIRFFSAWPAFFLFGVGYLWMYFDSNGDTAHDRLSATKVVVMPKSHKPFE